ncbi:MAG: hypothetical protein F7B59_00655 [Desulfurococcales archaeon]|nr:hypothetical protein [Desulfurococcales archaeon]
MTTSREPSNRTRSFINELVSTVPVFVKYNRGKATLEELLDNAISSKTSYILVVHEKKGNPGLIKVYHVNVIKHVLDEWFNLILKGITLYKEKTGSKPKPYDGKYCISYSVGTELLADLINRLTGYTFCLKRSDKEVSRYIEIDTMNELFVIRFYRQTGTIAGPIIRVRKIVDRSNNRSY